MLNDKLLLSKMIVAEKTKTDLAQHLSISYSTLLNKLTGSSDFKVGEVKKIISFLNLSHEEINEIFLF